MKKLILITTIIFIAAAGTGFVMANKANSSDVFSITISPKTLFLGSQDTIVTVHSNIPYVLVNTLSLDLNGIPASYTKADACGDLVVKFDREDIKGIVEPGVAKLTLSGQLKDGSLFAVSGTIVVK